MDLSFDNLDFDEIFYFEKNPYVAEAVAQGAFVSGEHHYYTLGAAEGRALRSRTDRAHGRIAIAGTGRSGTTLLVQIFTRLGFDTGFSQAEAMSAVDPISHAGLEHDLGPDSPVVVKSPWLGHHHRQGPSVRDHGVGFMLVPIRALEPAADSRRRVTQANLQRGGGVGPHSGGLWLTADPDEQERVLVEQFYQTMYLAARSDIDPTLVEYPRFALSDDYLWDRARALRRTYGVSRSELGSAMAEMVDRALLRER